MTVGRHDRTQSEHTHATAVPSCAVAIAAMTMQMGMPVPSKCCEVSPPTTGMLPDN